MRFEWVGSRKAGCLGRDSYCGVVENISFCVDSLMRGLSDI